MTKQITWDEFMAVDLRVGTITDVQDCPEARRPAYKLKIDFGEEIGVKQSSAQITELYKKEDLMGRQILGVVNFPPKQIGPYMSECLVTGFHTDNGVVLSAIDTPLQNGSRLA